MFLNRASPHTVVSVTLKQADTYDINAYESAGLVCCVKAARRAGSGARWCGDGAIPPWPRLLLTCQRVRSDLSRNTLRLTDVPLFDPRTLQPPL